MTSPPYWQARDYGVEGQLGLERNFNEYLQKLLEIFDEVKRVLKKRGTQSMESSVVSLCVAVPIHASSSRILENSFGKFSSKRRCDDRSPSNSVQSDSVYRRNFRSQESAGRVDRLCDDFAPLLAGSRLRR